MCDPARGYDREFTTPVHYCARRRFGYAHDRGTVTQFVVQLEYRYHNEWQPVVRYDHDPASAHGHDVTVEGIHMDVYRNGLKHRTGYVAPPMPAGLAIDFAEDHLAENVERFVERFEKWHGIKRR